MAPSLLVRLRDELAFIRGNLLVLIATYTIFRFAFSMHTPFQSLYIRELGASPFVIGLMSSIGSAILAVVRIPGSFIADKHGRKTIIVTFTYGATLAFLFYAFAPDWRFIILGIAISNLSHIYQPALEAIEADSIPTGRRGMGYSAINVIPMIPSIIAPPLGGFLVERIGLVPGMRMAYGVAFAGGIGAALLRTFFLKETVENPERLSLRALASSFRVSMGSILDAWRTMPREIHFYTIVSLIGSFEAPLFTLFMALYATDVIGVTGLQWSLMDTAWIVTTLIVGMPLGRLIDSMGRKRSILISYLLSTPIIALFIISRDFNLLLVSMMLFAAGQAIMYPAFMALQADLVPKDKRGRIMGMIGTLRLIAMIPAASIFGYLYQINPVQPFILAIFLELITVGVIFLRF